MASACRNQLVMVVGWVMAVPTTTAWAPVLSAARACSGVCTRPSATMGRPEVGDYLGQEFQVGSGCSGSVVGVAGEGGADEVGAGVAGG